MRLIQNYETECLTTAFALGFIVGVLTALVVWILNVL